MSHMHLSMHYIAKPDKRVNHTHQKQPFILMYLYEPYPGTTGEPHYKLNHTPNAAIYLKLADFPPAMLVGHNIS